VDRRRAPATVAAVPRTFDLFAACLPGLEPLLAQELTALGAEPKSLRGGVAFAGDAALAMRSCLWLGTASHLMLRLAEFPCRALGELQRKAAQLPWREWLRPNVPIEVRATTRGSRVYHTGAAKERIENAIAAAFGKPLGAATADDTIVAHVHVRFRDDVCTLSLDATSTPLHRRGYRLEGAKAPLREDLAHALVLASGWSGDTALLDPFCGSGTIVIEAAQLALGLPPGHRRDPAMEHLALFDGDAWQQARSQVPDRAVADRPRLAASDRDAGAVEAARRNAERAGVADSIEFECCAITGHPWLQAGGAPAAGTLATNPPFGLRVPKGDRLLPLYQTLGHRARALGAAWRVALLAHDVRLARRTGLPLRAAWTTKHGGLTVTALTGAAVAAGDD
jgi:putative N6-adenine-specific DNA methylase